MHTRIRRIAQAKEITELNTYQMTKTGILKYIGGSVLTQSVIEFT